MTTSSSSPPTATRPTARSVGGFLLAVLVALIPAVVLIAPAGAQPGSIDDVRFENETFVDGSRQSVTVDWSVPNPAVSPVTIGFDLPENLQGYPTSFPMTSPDGSRNGECVVTRERVECTVDPGYIQDNPLDVAGSFTFSLRTTLLNDETEVETFVIGGISRTVTVERNPNICQENCEYSQTRAKKSGFYNESDGTIGWIIDIPAGPDGIPAGTEISVTELFDPTEQELVRDEGKTYVTEARSVGFGNLQRELPRFERRTEGVTISEDGLTVSFEARAGLGPDVTTPPDNPESGSREGESRGLEGSLYRVIFHTRPLTEGEIQPNGDSVWSNEVEYTIEGTEPGNVTGTATRPSGSANVVGTNVGRIQLTKELSGDTTLSPEFEVRYTATDADGTEIPERTGTFTITAGGTWTSPDFDRGTTVVIQEILPEGPQNVDWAEPVLRDAEGNEITELTFSDENQNLGRISQLTLENRATLATGTFDAQKTVVNEDGVPLPADLDFTLDYSYPADAEKGFPAGEGSLEIPADGEVRTSEELPVGAVLTFTESAPTTVPGATWAAAEISPSTLTVGEGEGTQLVTVTNTIAQDVGGFSLVKSVSGEGADLVPEGAEFTVVYSYPEGDGYPAGSGEVTVVAGGEPVVVDGLPAGATVTLDEVRPLDPTGGTWGEPRFDMSEFVVTEGQVIPVSLDNPITWDDGDFSVAKLVEGDAADAVAPGTTFAVDYTYVLPAELGGGTGEGSLTVAADGTPVLSDPLPFGTVVTLSEGTPPAVPGASWTGAEFSATELTIGDGETIEVTLTNEISSDAGDLTIRKVITGDAAQRVPADATFLVTYSYPAGDGFAAGEGEVEVPATGDPVTIDGLPADAVVTLEEDPADPIPGTVWGAPAFEGGNVVTVQQDEVLEVILENPIAENPPEPTPDPDPEPTPDPDPEPTPDPDPEPTPEPTPESTPAPEPTPEPTQETPESPAQTGSLAHTGVELTLVPVAAALLLLLGGLGLLIRRRGN